MQGTEKGPQGKESAETPVDKFLAQTIELKAIDAGVEDNGEASTPTESMQLYNHVFEILRGNQPVIDAVNQHTGSSDKRLFEFYLENGFMINADAKGEAPIFFPVEKKEFEIPVGTTFFVPDKDGYKTQREKKAEYYAVLGHEKVGGQAILNYAFVFEGTEKLEKADDKKGLTHAILLNEIHHKRWADFETTEGGFDLSSTTNWEQWITWELNDQKPKGEEALAQRISEIEALFLGSRRPDGELNTMAINEFLSDATSLSINPEFVFERVLGYVLEDLKTLSQPETQQLLGNENYGKSIVFLYNQIAGQVTLPEQDQSPLPVEPKAREIELEKRLEKNRLDVQKVLIEMQQKGLTEKVTEAWIKEAELFKQVIERMKEIQKKSDAYINRLLKGLEEK